MVKLRKAFVISVMLITVLSMSVVVAPEVKAASAGDLIKMSGNSSVYYLAADGKRYVFPNESTYLSWYEDFSSVVTVSQSELENISLGKNITMRSGTKLVKITTDPKVYAVELEGNLVWIPSESVASTLYGANWANRVVDVSDAFFTNYTVASGEVSPTAYPAGSLVKFGTSDVYYIADDGSARKVADEAAFEANRFNWDFVIDATISMPSETGTDVTGSEDDLSDTSQGAGGTAGAGTGLSVSLASDTPAAASIIADSTGNEYPQALIPFTKVNLTAASDGDVKVTTLKFTRTGIASDSDLGSLYLYEGDTKIADYNSLSSKVLTFSNSAGLVTVSAGTTKTLTIKGDLARGSTSVTSGKTIGFDVTASTDVVTDGASVSGSFPMSGSLMSTASVSDLADFYFAGAAGSNGTIPSTVKADQAGVSLWTVNITAAEQKVQLKSVKFSLVGTIDSTDVQNIKLDIAGTQIGETSNLSSDKTVTFDLSDDGIYLTSGQTKSLGLTGDMMGGSGRVFKFTIQKSSDVVVMDTNYGIYITPTVNSATTAFGVVQQTTGNGTSVDAGTVTVGVATDSPTGNVADAGTGVTLAKFSFYAAGEDVKVDNLTASSTCSDTAIDLVNVKLLLDGSQVGTTDSSMGCDNDSTNFTFGNTFVIPAGETRYVTVVADLTNTNVSSSDTIAMALAAGSGNGSGQTTLTSLSTTAQTARTLTVASGTATAVENTSFTDRNSTTPSGTVSASSVKIASFIVTAGAGEAINVTQIGLKDNATTQVGDNFQNLKIKKSDGTQIGSTIASCNTTAGTYTFTPATAIKVEAGQQLVVDVYADIKSSVADSATSLNPVIAFDSVTATGVNTSSDASYTTDVDLQAAYISANGNLTVTLDSDSALAQQLVMGSTDVELARFKFAASAAEDINVSKIVVNDLLSSAASGTIKNLKLFDGTTQVGQTISLTSNYASTTYGAFDGLSLTIPQNSNKVLVLKGDVNTYSNGGLSASTHALSIYETYDGTNASITAVGASSGASLAGTSNADSLDIGADTDVQAVWGNTMTVYRTKLTVSWASDSPSGASVGGDDYTVAKVNITNASNTGSYVATVQSLNFAISQTGISNTANRELKIYKDSITSGNLLVTTSWLAVGLQNFGDSAVTDAGMTNVEITAGATKTFIITMDTNDAGSDDKLSINVAAGDVVWGDGIETGITTVDSLPLSPKTLTY